MIKLPINIQPPIITYLHHAYPLSIVMADDSYLPWFRSNFIQLYAHTDYPKKRNTAFNFFTKYHFMDSAKGIAPLGTMALESSLISRNYQGGVMQYVKDNLQLGHFVIAWIDEFYVSRSSFYQIQHQFHE